jgi:hypothetical protein
MAELPLILHADSATNVKWWDDGSHAIHPNMHGHSGGCVSLGMGMPITGSSKQKLNTHSSTEMELIMVDDFMPQILWTNLFLEAQDYKTWILFCTRITKVTSTCQVHLASSLSEFTWQVHLVSSLGEFTW